MSYRKLLILLVGAWSFVGAVLGQTIIKTSLSDEELTLPCESINSTDGEAYQWIEIITPSQEEDIYGVGSAGVISSPTDQKYGNFRTDVSSYPTSVPLIIDNISPEDEGVYKCTAVFDGYRLTYDVHVEVIATVVIKNGSLDVESLTVTVGESYAITCTATRARSRNELTLLWEPPLQGGTVIELPNGDFTDYTITSTYTPQKEDSSIRCQLTGYVLQDEIRDLVSDSVSVTVQCPTTEPITTTERISTTVNTNINDTPGIYTGLIAACSMVAVIFVTAMVFVIVILIRRYQIGPRKETNQSSPKEVEATNDGTDNNAYMDLQEMGNEKSRDTDTLQIPDRNVKLISILSGNGFLQYHKALITRANGNQEGVVRTLSDNSTLAAIKILRSEVQENLKLGNDNNIVQLLGWCDTVPTYAIFELVRGRNLPNHLKEEFNPHSVHTYGNTKKKSFQVSEKGNIDVLPKYALHVARGMQFLTKNKFLHPGLRAKQVLLDTTGNCKLYDFVSLENAKEWTRLTWNESVPYQWMPPEFLFLEAISSAGDIWSFGVLLWEIFSYGSEPYIGQTRSDVEKKIRQKELLRMPNNCPGAIWQLMLSCWQSPAEERLPIDNITARLTSMCHQDRIIRPSIPLTVDILTDV